MAKAMIGLFDDVDSAKRFMHDLYRDGYVQRDFVKLISGQLDENALEWFEANWIEKNQQHYISHLAEGGAIVIAWVINVFRKEAKDVFERHTSQVEVIRGRRWVGFNSTRT